MPSTMENLSTINSFIRTVLATVVLAAAGVAGWFGYTTFNKSEIAAKQLLQANEQLEATKKGLDAAKAELVVKDGTIKEQVVKIDTLNKDVERLETTLALIKVDYRLARLTVLDQGVDQSSGQTFSLVEFVEVDDKGKPIDTPREFRIPGEQVYVDNWIVKFDDKYIERADLERGTSLILFHRIFGDKQQPADGFPLDEVGTRPQAYARGSQMTDLEKKIWGDFWNIANNKQLAEDLGIRAAHGLALSIKLQKGASYLITMRAGGDLSFIVEKKPETPVAR
ncbi:hypothetical protein ETAA8_38070 [Anatilimnocola aggregata]|uniref:Uncharacterized protein n=1 Tax=Anatilimnocola aggregata TaxID=2528021 RepID=A0A517YEX0_9BACT|nr:hypothetical protein [Anatilimnocola aggregata]QDU28702.1 hypothetical protein ETAA8_38070 [Anatilimnocola aggregata]